MAREKKILQPLGQYILDCNSKSMSYANIAEIELRSAANLMINNCTVLNHNYVSSNSRLIFCFKLGQMTLAISLLAYL